MNWDVPFHSGRGHARPHHQAGVVRHLADGSIDVWNGLGGWVHLCMLYGLGVVGG